MITTYDPNTFPPNDPRLLTVEYLITREFHTSLEFSVYIESEARRRNLGCFETLLEYCEKNDIEPVSVSTLITPSLKEKIQVEVEDLNLIRKKKGKLPL